MFICVQTFYGKQENSKMCGILTEFSRGEPEELLRVLPAGVPHRSSGCSRSPDISPVLPADLPTSWTDTFQRPANRSRTGLRDAAQKQLQEEEDGDSSSSSLTAADGTVRCCFTATCRTDFTLQRWQVSGQISRGQSVQEHDCCGNTFRQSLCIWKQQQKTTPLQRITTKFSPL